MLNAKIDLFGRIFISGGVQTTAGGVAKLWARSAAPATSVQAQHVGHVVEAGFLVEGPQRRPERTAHKDFAAFGAVGELDPLAVAGEDHHVVADDRTAAQRRE